MALTILAIPFLFFGVFVKTQDVGLQRCIGVGQSTYCFEQSSTMPEKIKYGSVLVGFGLLYLGRRQIQRSRGK
ncbi:MAG: hypothetical protein WDN48_02205 [Pseudolabrys sp.]